MSTGLLDIMKRASLDAVENSKPSDLRYGTVLSTSPLKIQVTNQMVLPQSVLIVPQYLTDYEIDITVHDWLTENKSGGSGDPAFASHNHLITGKKTITVHAALKVGDKVVLIRQAGGQNYLVVDRLIS